MMPVCVWGGIGILHQTWSYLKLIDASNRIKTVLGHGQFWLSWDHCSASHVSLSHIVKQIRVEYFCFLRAWWKSCYNMPHALGGPFCYSNSYPPARTIRVSDFLRNKCSKQEGKKQKERSKFVFPCKNGLKQWWTEHSYCTRSPLLTYTITECLSARSGFSRSVPIYCHLYATILLMPTAYRHTSRHRNVLIVIIQETTHMRSIHTHEFRVLMARQK